MIGLACADAPLSELIFSSVWLVFSTSLLIAFSPRKGTVFSERSSAHPQSRSPAQVSLYRHMWILSEVAARTVNTMKPYRRWEQSGERVMNRKDELHTGRAKKFHQPSGPYLVSDFGKYSFHCSFTYSQNPFTGLLLHSGTSSFPVRVSITVPTLMVSSCRGRTNANGLP